MSTPVAASRVLAGPDRHRRDRGGPRSPRAQDAGRSADVRASYVKQEVMIPMRDGTRLFTIIYAPRDTSRRYPFMLTRTAYGIAPYGPDNYRAVRRSERAFTREGYIFVYQDARGRFKSEGTFVHHLPVRCDRAGPTKAPTPTTRSSGC